MCGIFCCISDPSSVHNCLEGSEVEQLLKNRGPNAAGIKKIENVIFGGFVLWQQGLTLCDQPVESNSHLLLFNGDIFNIDKYKIQEMSDTEWIFKQLSKFKTEDELIKYFKTLEGPFSLIFYNKLDRIIYFARDSLGRNSLLVESNSQHFRLLNTSDGLNKNNNTMELPPLGIYKVSKDGVLHCSLFPWRSPYDDLHPHIEQLKRFCSIKINIEKSIEPSWFNVNVNVKKYKFNFYDMVTNINFLSASELYESLLSNVEVFNAVIDFSRLLEASVKNRVQNTTKFCKSCLEEQKLCNHSKIAILFSGGIDCSILAVLCDKFAAKTDSIDLVNVAFENTKLGNNWNVPDRISAKSSLMNLRDICPDRIWNFIEVNVTKQELHEQLGKHIKHLIYPLNTVLDESIGCAFWFASRALGLKEDNYWQSLARVVLVGSGADELFGGYVRHKNSYVRYSGTVIEKEINLLKELEKDWSRIPSRNLARDDRVISDNGKTPRSPFIEEHLVNFVRSLNPSQRCCFLLEDGVGDKLFLRLYGYYLGLTSSSFLKKRAIQFGSRIANKKQNATDRSIYL